MHFPTLFTISSSLLALALGAAMPMTKDLAIRDITLTVTTDGATAQITVITAATTEATGSDVGGKADVVGAVGDVVSKVVKLVQGMVDNDLERRRAFTQNVAAEVRAATGLNVVVSNVGYTFTGTPTDVTSTSYNAKVGSDVSFDVVTFSAGTFDLKGNGGFENWAYIVNGTCDAVAANKHIVC